MMNFGKNAVPSVCFDITVGTRTELPPQLGPVVATQRQYIILTDKKQTWKKNVL